jgi:hypothetical protein
MPDHKQMKVLSVSIDLVELEGGSYFPLDEPIPWDISIHRTASEILESFPDVLESLLSAIRVAVKPHTQQTNVLDPDPISTPQELQQFKRMLDERRVNKGKEPEKC